ncbi:MAG: 5'-nucleotidase, lipoprotein e(P4) family [Bacteroidales bacterium]|nr:5'-nucleotidase, lipoprotein e(P4) family [Bacteroidales bacterium]
MKHAMAYFSLSLLVTACCVDTGRKVQSLMGAQALLWSQFSAEAEALYLQGYNIAGEIITEYDASVEALPPAVTLDIDETVLDNSPFNVQMLCDGAVYSEKRWVAWCERREAAPIPGALAFTRLADSLGVEVFYVSNRSEELLNATIDNLRKHGFPNADSAHVFLKTTTSSKDERRAAISRGYQIILLLGDNLGDFAGLFDDRSEAQGKPFVRAEAANFGKRYILFPNPVYGTWEHGVFPGGRPDGDAVMQQLRGYE